MNRGNERTMKNISYILPIVLCLVGCASQSQKESDIEERELFDQMAAEKKSEFEQQAELERQKELARREAVVREQQDRIARKLEDQKSKTEESSGTPEIATLSESDVQGAELGPGENGEINSAEIMLTKKAIYFAYDRFDIQKKFIPLVEAHSNFLIQNPEIKILIHGHCDVRGSREYNLALGQRRADSVKRAMLLVGVNDNQIETVSFGSEKPVAFGQDEESHSENRRVDLVYQ